MSPAEHTNQSDDPRHRRQRGSEFDASNGAQATLNAKPEGRGWRADNDKADSAMPGRELGASGQIDNGPDATAGAGDGDDQ